MGKGKIEIVVGAAAAFSTSNALIVDNKLSVVRGPFGRERVDNSTAVAELEPAF
jgi:hypothetical protein